MFSLYTRLFVGMALIQLNRRWSVALAAKLLRQCAGRFDDSGADSGAQILADRLEGKRPWKSAPSVRDGDGGEERA